MSHFDFAVGLRSDVQARLKKISDAEQGMGWDTTTDNTSTRWALERMFGEWLEKAREIGIRRVRRHHSCMRSSHDGDVFEGLGDIAPGDEAWEWNVARLADDDAVAKCPCSPRGKPRMHWVIDELIIRKDGDATGRRRIAEALALVQSAIDHSNDRRRRSAIREQLLRAVLVLNDAILPEPVEDYIANRRATG